MTPKDYEVIYKITVAQTVHYPSALNWNAEPVGELIRCKDCIRWRQSKSDITAKVCDWDGYVKTEKDYCSWAKRKEE